MDLLISVIASCIANLLFISREIIRYVQKFRSQRVLLKFWGNQNRPWFKFWEKPKKNKAYIYYPGYPNPRVGRTEKNIGDYLSDEDAKTVELLQRGLEKLGFDCQRKKVINDKFDADPLVPKHDIAVYVCGPKLEPKINKVVYDRWTGGNTASSSFYHRYHRKIGIELQYDHTNKRKQYRIPPMRVVGTDTLQSPQDDNPPKNMDRGLLIRVNIDGNLYFLCWGIHGLATLGAVKAALSAEHLKKFPLGSENIMAVIDVKENEDVLVEENENVKVEAVGFDLIPDPEKIKMPHPYEPTKWLSEESAVYGLSYLWATADNVSKVKEGRYHELAPVAAEFDTSLCCPYNCEWCPYQSGRTGDVLKDTDTALAIVDRLQERGVKLIVLTGGGEPLVSKCVEAVVERCKDHEIKVILYTNGLLLNDLRAYHLMSRGISEIRISLDDVSDLNNYRDIHDIKKSRINDDMGVKNLKGDWNAMKVIEKNTQQLLELRARLGFSTIIGASFLVSDKTLPNLKQSAETLSMWLQKVGSFDYVVIRPAVHYWPESNESHNAHYKNPDIEAIREAALPFKDKGVARHIFISDKRFENLNKQGGTAYDRCLASTLWLNIGPDGTAYQCCETKHNNIYELGNILEGSIKKLIPYPLNQETKPIPNGCPVLLCKPSALNQLFCDIEKKRKPDQKLPGSLIKWLDGIEKYNNNAETLIPSVSGIYEEYPTPSE
jgi:sulfatase maturation enzyme AslB (radical SAM superfamily)